MGKREAVPTGEEEAAFMGKRVAIFVFCSPL
jgi:hypothetical protein